jgi:hypothetical protein
MRSRTLLTIVRVYIAVLVVVMVADLLGLINNGQSSLERSQFILIILLLGLLGMIAIQGMNFLRRRQESARNLPGKEGPAS